jgi:cell wall-associated NlpC family hydrolase
MGNPDDVLESPIKLSVQAAPVVDSETEQVIATARAQKGKPYRLGAEGPDRYDCSGLVYYCFQQNGLAALIGGGRHRANWYWNWFNTQGLTIGNKFDAERGDLVCYGTPDKVTHIGIYLGNFRRKPQFRLISALENPWGVSITGVDALLDVDGSPLPVVGYCKVAYAS